MPVAKPFQQDLFRPVLFTSRSLDVSAEQKTYIRKILEIASSDIQFAQKAADAITYILTVGSTVVPLIASLNPSSKVLGSPNFTLRVLGNGFNANSVILWNGSPEPTTFVSVGEVTTVVNMATAQFPVAIGVEVQNENGLLSNSMIFTFLP